ncbi:hypothetical protein GEMRC1_007055 [Eukaryota sp. GEM-RC1]
MSSSVHSRRGLIRFSNRPSTFRSLDHATAILQSKNDPHSIALLTITSRMNNGEVLTISEIRSILQLPSTITEDEVINTIVSHLPLYVYKEPGLKDSICVPVDVIELLHVVANQHRPPGPFNTPIVDSQPLKPKRGSYSCSICGKLGHTKAKCPGRWQGGAQNIQQNPMLSSNSPPMVMQSQYMSPMSQRSPQSFPFDPQVHQQHEMFQPFLPSLNADLIVDGIRNSVYIFLVFSSMFMSKLLCLIN